MSRYRYDSSPRRKKLREGDNNYDLVVSDGCGCNNGNQPKYHIENGCRYSEEKRRPSIAHEVIGWDERLCKHSKLGNIDEQRLRRFAEECVCTCGRPSCACGPGREKVPDRYLTEAQRQYIPKKFEPVGPATSDLSRKNQSQAFPKRKPLPGTYTTETKDKYIRKPGPAPPLGLVEPEACTCEGPCDCCKARAYFGLPQRLPHQHGGGYAKPRGIADFEQEPHTHHGYRPQNEACSCESRPQQRGDFRRPKNAWESHPSLERLPAQDNNQELPSAPHRTRREIEGQRRRIQQAVNDPLDRAPRRQEYTNPARARMTRQEMRELLDRQGRKEQHPGYGITCSYDPCPHHTWRRGGVCDCPKAARNDDGHCICGGVGGAVACGCNEEESWTSGAGRGGGGCTCDERQLAGRAPTLREERRTGHRMSPDRQKHALMADEDKETAPKYERNRQKRSYEVGPSGCRCPQGHTCEKCANDTWRRKAEDPHYYDDAAETEPYSYNGPALREDPNLTNRPRDLEHKVSASWDGGGARPTLQANRNVRASWDGPSSTTMRETVSSRMRRLEKEKDPKYFKLLDQRRKIAARPTKRERERDKRMQKPDFHNYGRNASNPTRGGVMYGDYLMTHNVQPQIPPNRPRTKQIYENLERKALESPEKVKFRGKNVRYAPKDTQFDPFEDKDSLTCAEKALGLDKAYRENLYPAPNATRDQREFYPNKVEINLDYGNGEDNGLRRQGRRPVQFEENSVHSNQEFDGPEHLACNEEDSVQRHPSAPNEIGEPERFNLKSFTKEDLEKLGNDPKNYNLLPKDWVQLITPAGRKTVDGDHVVDCIYLYD